MLEVLGGMTMQVFIRGNWTMIAAAVQCDVDGIPKGLHYAKIPIATGQPNDRQLSRGPHASLGHDETSAGLSAPTAG